MMSSGKATTGTLCVATFSFGAIALVIVSCASGHSQNTKNVLSAITPIPTAAPLFKSYPISAAFAKNGPHLSAEQRAWISKVRTSRAYAPMRRRLRFAVLRGVTVPIVMWVDQAAPGQQDHGGHIIGEYCSEYFDPVNRGIFGATEASCARPTFAPVD